MLDAMETAEDPMKDLVVIDADGHVEEHDLTFSDKYLDPAFRAQRPQVVATDGLAYWMIEEQLFPRRLGRGCHNLGTPTSYGGKRTLFTQSKPESLESLELRGPDARLRDMRSEEHTSELQSRLHLVCRLLLEKKKDKRFRTPAMERMQLGHRRPAVLAKSA